MNVREKRKTRKNPEETSNFISLLFFGWTVPIFRKGAKRDLKITDLYDPLESTESERLGDLLEREWKKELMRAESDSVPGKDGQKAQKRKPDLLWAIVRVFRIPCIIQGLLLLVDSVILRNIQPVLQGYIISYFKPGENPITRNQVYLDASLLVITNLASIFTNQHVIAQNRKIGMCIRVACCSLIYRKVLRLDQAAMSGTAAGQVVNLISNDVARFDIVTAFIFYIWITPIQVFVAGWVIWKSVGVAALVGIGAMLIQMIPIQGYSASLGAKFRSLIAEKTDERVQLMSELISGIKTVKMYSWEKPVEVMISSVRALEVKFIGYTSYLRGFSGSVGMLSGKISLYLTLIVFVLMGNPLDADITFLLATLLSMIHLSCAFWFPRALMKAGETAVSLKRINEFLLLDEVRSNVKDSFTVINGIEHGVGIEMIDVAANWVHGHLPPSLCKVSLEVNSRSLCAIVGPVGSGKSSLLHLILGELPVGAGRLTLSTGENGQTKITSRDIRISYASQDSWIFAASIRDNILFGQPFDERRYKEVTRVCALVKDFEQLPQGDLTFVGERGSSLSGGQRARMNLARAVYRDAELYLLDDPLSAVDARVGRHLFEECISGFLKDKTRILVTHQLQYLRQADTVVVIDRGTVKRQGTYEELADDESNFHIFDSEESEESGDLEHTEENREDNAESEVVTNEAMTAGNDNQLLKVTGNSGEPEAILDEAMVTGEISNAVFSEYFLSGGSVCALIFLAASFIAGNIATSGIDYWVSYWTDLETLRVALQSNESAANNLSYRNDTKSDYQEAESQWFDKYGLVSSNLAIFIYTACIVVGAMIAMLYHIFFMKICIKASRTIHDSMFSNLLQSTMRFFDTNPSGRILNRFSKDLGTLDERLPNTMLDTLNVLSAMTGAVAMVIIVNYWMALPAVIIGLIFYLVRNYYLNTARDIERFEGIAKSPVFSHASSTLDGLPTIRSRGSRAEELLRREFDSLQDAHTSAWYLAIGTAGAFGLFLDLITTSFIASICFSFILLDDEQTVPGSVGLAISQSLALSGKLQFGMKQSAELISQMVSVERVLQYTNLPKEGPFTTENPPPPTWPSKGGLVFKNVSMRYADNKPPVLKNLNLNIKAGWKVGIVGRTGAGKSSLISALFSLTGDGLEGEIALDGIDTKSIGLHELRSRISIIPQEPILFSASLRYNLDPFDQYSDSELWDSLREVELGDAVPSLDFHVAGGGSNFSVGQRQLICLARVILENNRVLVLDEATANIDSRTDVLIQNTIRRRFADCTVLTIAHRLNTIMDSDRVLVMAEGRAVEFGHPHLLLKNGEGHFSRMLQQTGNAMADKLAGIAENAYLSGPEFMEKSNDEMIAETKDQFTYL